MQVLFNDKEKFENAATYLAQGIKVDDNKLIKGQAILDIVT